MTIFVDISKQSAAWRKRFLECLHEESCLPYEPKPLPDLRKYELLIELNNQKRAKFQYAEHLLALCLINRAYIEKSIGLSYYYPILSFNRSFAIWCLLEKKATKFWIHDDGRVTVQ